MSKVELLDGFSIPKIFISKRAIAWVESIVDLHHTEVGFYGTVIDHENGEYTIDDIFYPKHDLATGATCEISSDGMTEIMEYLIAKDRLEDIGRLKMWGHSHVNMGVSPSGQDDTMGLELAKDNGTFLIRMITNKKGVMGITFYDMVNKVKFTDLTITERDNEEYPEEVLDNIQGVLTDGGIGPLEAVRIIDDIIYEWKNGVGDLNAIDKKVKELKKVNIPVSAYNGNFGRVWNSTTRRWESKSKVAQPKPGKTTNFTSHLAGDANVDPFDEDTEIAMYEELYGQGF